VPFAQVAPPSEEAAEAFAAAAALVDRPITVADTSTGQAPEAVVASLPVAAEGTKILLWCGIGTAALLLCGLSVVAVYTSGRSDDATTVPASARHLVARPPNFSEQEPAPQTAAVETQVAVTPMQTDSRLTSQPVHELVADTNEAAVDQEEPLHEDDAVATENEPQLEIDASARTAVKTELETSPNPAAATSESQPEPVLRFDPLDFDPARLSLNATTHTDRADTSNSVPQVAADESLRPAADTDVEPDAMGLLGRPVENASVAVRLGAVVRGGENPLTIARHFSLPVRSLNVRDIRLDRFVTLVSSMSGVPITLDPLALELAGVAPQTAVTVHTNDTALEPLVRSLLAKNRLALEDRDGRLVIGLANGSERSTKRYDVSDLVQSTAADAREIAQTIESFVSPVAWPEGAGRIEIEGNTLTVNQTKTIHHELLIFCERWRLVLGLQPRSRYPVNRLSTESPYSIIDVKLKRPTTFTYLPWTRLDELVRHWEQSAGVTILVDWLRLADVELEPSTPIACSAVDRPWGEALDVILEQLGLTWWAVDGQAVQITTRDALYAIQKTEFYPVSKTMREQFSSAEALVDSLRSELHEHFGDKASNAEHLRMRLDVPSRRLIVRGSPLVHRYLAQHLANETDQ
jgi:hypothetical protein